MYRFLMNGKFKESPFRPWTEISWMWKNTRHHQSNDTCVSSCYKYCNVVSETVLTVSDCYSCLILLGSWTHMYVVFVHFVAMATMKINQLSLRSQWFSYPERMAKVIGLVSNPFMWHRKEPFCPGYLSEANVLCLPFLPMTLSLGGRGCKV